MNYVTKMYMSLSSSWSMSYSTFLQSLFVISCSIWISWKVSPHFEYAAFRWLLLMSLIATFTSERLCYARITLPKPPSPSRLSWWYSARKSPTPWQSLIFFKHLNKASSLLKNIWRCPSLSFMSMTRALIGYDASSNLMSLTRHLKESSMKISIGFLLL